MGLRIRGMDKRIHLYILLVLAPWLVHNGHRMLQVGFTLALLIITLLHFGRTAYDHARLSVEMAEEVSAVNLIEPHTTYPIRSASWNKSDSLGEVTVSYTHLTLPTNREV